MCGIVAFISKRELQNGPKLIDKALSTLGHRGPDNRSIFNFENIFIGFLRLSIVDELGGNQPLYNEDRNILVFCNGEIYNFKALRKELEQRGHHFYTNTDAEVITHLYEEDANNFIARLDGMFSIILIDKQRRVIKYGRDRLGIKPLFYYEDNEKLILASEAKAIHAMEVAPQELNRQAVYDFFAFNYIPGTDTVFQGIHHVAPATLATFDLSHHHRRDYEYWSPHFPQFENRWHFAKEYTERFRHTFESAVESTMMADFPVATSLSGGIDSTTTALILRDKSPSHLTIKSYSIKFPGESCDESAIFEPLIKRNGFDPHIHTAVAPTTESFAKTLYHIGQPQMSPLDIPLQQLAQAMRHAGTKVVLSGEGADELLGGYSYHALNQVRRALEMTRIQSLKKKFWPFFIKRIAETEDPSNILSRSMTENVAEVIAKFGSFPVWYPEWQRLIHLRKGLFLNEDQYQDSLGEQSAVGKVGHLLRTKYSTIDEFNKGIYWDLKTRLPNYILSRSDRNSMAHSVETRVPFLTNQMVDMTASIPPILKMFGLKEKYILRKAFKDILPPNIASRRKFGYLAPPEYLWKQQDSLRDEMLDEKTIRTVGIFSPEKIKMLQAEHASTKSEFNRHTRSFTLTGVLAIQIFATRILKCTSAAFVLLSESYFTLSNLLNLDKAFL